MRIALAPSPPAFSVLIAIGLKQAFHYLISAEAHYRNRSRLDDLPPERLRDMGLKGSAPCPSNPLSQAGNALWSILNCGPAR
jgi:hypothetical protein